MGEGKSFLSIIFFTKIFHFAVYGQPHCRKACQPANQVGNWFCQENAVYAKAKRGQQQGQRNDDDNFAEQRKENGAFCKAKRLKGALPGKLECHKAVAEKV